MYISRILILGCISSLIAIAGADQCRIPRGLPKPAILDTENNKLNTATAKPSTTKAPSTTTNNPSTTNIVPTTTEKSDVPSTTSKSTTTTNIPTTSTTLSSSTTTLTPTTTLSIDENVIDANLTLDSEYVNGSEINAEALTSDEHFDIKTCPGENDPVNNTICCSSIISGTVTIYCCPPDASWLEEYLFLVNDQLAMMIAISVTAGCFLITVTIIICCCWSPCPLYTACRVKYHQDDIIAYASKDEETAGLNEMPPEEKKGVTIYSPNTVKVTMKEDV